MASNESSSTRTILLAVVTLAILVAIGFGLRTLLRAKTEVRTGSVSYEDLTSTASTNGKVQPMEVFEAHAPMPTTVDKIMVDVGEVVKPGQLLMHLNDADAVSRVATARSAVAGAQAVVHDIQSGGAAEERIGISSDLQKAQLQQQQAQKDLAALQQLQQKGAASGSEVLAAQQRLLSAQASVTALQQRSSPGTRYSSQDRARANAQLADASANLSSSQKLYAQANIRAPFAGTVYSLPVAESDFVPAGEPLLAMADLSRIQVTAYFDEPEIGKLAINQPVTIVWDAKPGRVWHGHILQVPTEVKNYGTRNVGECFITVDDAHGDLLPNTNVTVTVTTMQHPHVLSIPREALHTQGAQNYVFRVLNGKLVRTAVQVGALNLTRVEITGGLSANDTVAIASTDNSDLADGVSVKAVQ